MVTEGADMRTGTLGLWLGLLLACAAGTDAPRPPDAASETGAPPAGGRLAPTGEFDPARAGAGDSVGGLEIVAMDVRRVFDDSVWAGRVEFRGRLTVDGVYQRHFDYPEPAALCFHVLGDAVERVPHFVPDQWTSTNRKTWFCFDNEGRVLELLGGGETPLAATIVVDGYRLIREFSDVFDMAKLVEVVELRGPARQTLRE
jgi:hypothetical protein